MLVTAEGTQAEHPGEPLRSTLIAVHDRPELPERLAPLDKKIAGQETIRLKLKLSKPLDGSFQVSRP